MRLRVILTALVISGGGILSGGCQVAGGGPKGDSEQLAQTRSELRDRTRENRELQGNLRAQREQIDSLLALGEKRLQKLFHVQRIALGRHTGAVDLDGDEEDDAIRVYLRPIDQDGSVIKAAGNVKIQLFDLGTDPKENLIARYEWTPEGISKQWSGTFMTQHFSFDCPLDKDPGRYDEITVRLEFTDYLTGRTFTAQKVCKVRVHDGTEEK